MLPGDQVARHQKPNPTQKVPDSAEFWAKTLAQGLRCLKQCRGQRVARGNPFVEGFEYGDVGQHQLWRNDRPAKFVENKQNDGGSSASHHHGPAREWSEG